MVRSILIAARRWASARSRSRRSAPWNQLRTQYAR